MPLTPKTRLGPYEIVASLGAGGMGEVYHGRDTRLGRDVALKILPDLVARDRERLARFDREAKLLAALAHPNVATLYALEDIDDRTVLVMELAPGEVLSHRIDRGGLALEEPLPIARQVAAALEAAHDKCIVHRDLKPANIKVDADRSGPPTSAAPVMAPSSTGNGIKAKGEIRTQFCHVIDIAPTVLEAAGIAAPTIVNSVRAAGHVRDLASTATRLFEISAHRDRLAGNRDGPRLVAVAGTGRLTVVGHVARDGRWVGDGACGRSGAARV